MSDRARSWVAIAVIAVSLGVVLLVLAGGPSTPEDRAHAIAVRLKCPVCESESIADSPAQVARDSYGLIQERVDDGWTDAEIIDFFVSTYGQSVLLDPPAGGSTIFLWLAPLAVLAVGALIVAGRRAASPRAVSDDEKSRIQAELEARQ